MSVVSQSEGVVSFRDRGPSSLPNALPVFSTLSDGFRQLGRHMPALLPMLGIVAVVNIALGVLHQTTFDGSPANSGFGHTALRVVLVYAMLLPIMTSLQRRIILGDEGRTSFTFQREEWLVLGGWLRIFFLFYAFAGALSSIGFTSGLLGTQLDASIPAALPMIIGLNAVLWLVLLVHLLRVSFTLSARAIGLPLTLAQASTAVGGRLWGYVAVSLLAALPLAALGGGLIVAADPTVSEIVGMVCGGLGLLYMAAVSGVVFLHLFPPRVGAAQDASFVEGGEDFLDSVRNRIRQVEDAHQGWRPPWRSIVVVFAVIVNVAIVQVMGGVDVFLMQAQDLMARQGEPLAGLAGAVPSGLASAAGETLKDKADQGNSYSQFLIGVAYATGRNSVAKNMPEAVRYYKLAVAQGSWKAATNLGWIYRNGAEGVPRNEAEAVRLFKLAADQGDAKAEYALADMYRDGQGGLPKNEVAAGNLFIRAADKGDVFSQTTVGWMYQIGAYGVTKNEVEAVRYYKLAVAQGEDNAAGMLAAIYIDGLGGIARNPDEAVRLLEQGMKHGNAAAYFMMGRLYDQGDRGLPKNDAKAAELYRKAVALGYQPAQDNLNAMEGRPAK
jgi:TPR repeat protein